MQGLEPEHVTIPARDGYRLAGTLYRAPSGALGTVVINAAVGVPRRFYRHFAAGLAAAGLTALTWDYRGVGGSRPPTLRGFAATAHDWALLDIPGVIDWAVSELRRDRLFLVGHSFGGQTAGLLDDPWAVDAMVTMSAQSGHWRLQGGAQKLVVLLHAWLSLPLLARVVGFMPMRRLGMGEDLPRGVALEWARWCRDPDYLLGDDSLPLDRYATFAAPVLAYSFADDAWGTARSVATMMRAYPKVELRHVEPADFGLARIGHLGFFRPGSEALWRDAIGWLMERVE
ncbi:MAG TPA: alpha/beta fold hydrolase [Candidatus Sulfomarinibacteraceae bacterium]|nr:alpha/beta fold hydrolase [Candidatus Sulfomarinibacteraceae bacterium]